MAKISPSFLSLEFFCKNSIYLRVRLRERFDMISDVQDKTFGDIVKKALKKNIN